MVEEPQITTISEKGQIVIPKDLRKHLSIKPKTKFLVFGSGDTIIIKRLQLPDVRKEWDEIFRAIDKKGLKITEKDVQKEIQAFRKEKRSRNRR